MIFLLIGGFLLALAASAIAADIIEYSNKETKELIDMVNAGAALVSQKGGAAFNDFSETGTRWNHDDTYMFVLDPQGNMLYHPDPKLDLKNQLNLADIDGRPIVRSCIDRALDQARNNQGFVHYKWPKPGKLFPVWKSTFVKLAEGPRGKKFIVCSGRYELKPEKRFITDRVDEAAAMIELSGDKAFDSLRDRVRGFYLGNLYVFVDDDKGMEIVNPAFPELEGKNLLELKDAGGKYMVRDYITLAAKQGSGWTEYLWPKPEESVPSRKSTYVKKVDRDNGYVVVGSGYYFDGPATQEAPKMNSRQLTEFVREGALLIKTKGEAAFPEFRKNNTFWFNNNDYLFVWDMNGIRTVYPPNPSMEGVNVLDLKDVRQRPIGRAFYAAVSNPSGEGWVYYEWPKPGELYSSWKATFLKIAVAQSKKEYVIGGGVYEMKLEPAQIVDRVEKAAALIGREGRAAFEKIRDKSGQFVFMDNYVFVDLIDGVELINPGFPSLEGKNLIDCQDSSGRKIVKEYIDLASKNGSGWIEYDLPRPGRSSPSKKRVYVKLVTANGESFVVGSGEYVD